MNYCQIETVSDVNYLTTHRTVSRCGIVDVIILMTCYLATVRATYAPTDNNSVSEPSNTRQKVGRNRDIRPFKLSLNYTYRYKIKDFLT